MRKIEIIFEEMLPIIKEALSDILTTMAIYQELAEIQSFLMSK